MFYVYAAIPEDGEGLSPMAEESECDIVEEEEEDDETNTSDKDEEEVEVKKEMLHKLDGVVSIENA